MTTRYSLSLCSAAVALALLAPAAVAACAAPGATLISQLQGSGDASPLVGQTVTIEGVVSATVLGADQAKGFYLQEEAAEQDGDANTSEGVFVYTGKLLPVLKAGDVVRVSGKVVEFKGETQLQPTALTAIEACGTSATATVAALRLPLAAANSLEALEGMLVNVAQPLYVAANYGYGRYGELTLSSQPRLWTSTQKFRPGSAEGKALMAANALDKLILDDGYTVQNRNAWLPAPAGLSAADTVRAGDQLSGVSGVVSYLAGSYRLQPVAAPQLLPQNRRPAAPQRAAGSVRVASFNVLNYFNGDGSSSDTPFKDAANRGAKNYADFLRQRAKIVSAIRGLDADVVGLMELENDGYGDAAAIQDLVRALNDGQPAAKHYAFVHPGMDKIGSDAIAVGMLYRPAVVKPDGVAQVKEVGDASKNRPSLAQSFYLDSKGVGRPLTVVVSHLKSKGSSCAPADPDLADGQGNCNLTRVQAVTDLKNWLAAGDKGLERSILLIGDFNAYAKEDPIHTLEQGGFSNLLASFHGESVYSYVFNGESGNLDHALATKHAAQRVLAAGEWHINADEPTALEYSSEFKSAEQQQKYYAADAYRSSDHDPLYVDLKAEATKPAAADSALLGLFAALGVGALWRRRRG